MVKPNWYQFSFRSWDKAIDMANKWAVIKKVRHGEGYPLYKEVNHSCGHKEGSLMCRHIHESEEVQDGDEKERC